MKDTAQTSTRIPTKRKANPLALPDTDIQEMLDLCEGQIHRCALALDVDPVQLHYRIQSDYKLKQLVLDHREVMIDKAEEKLAEKVDAGNLRAITFALKTLGRHRGYVERSVDEPMIAEVPSAIDLSTLGADKLKQLGQLLTEARGLASIPKQVIEIDQD